MTPASVTLRLVGPDDGRKHPETTRVTRTQPAPTLLHRRRKILIPNQAVALVLDGPDGARLSLHSAHHTNT